MAKSVGKRKASRAQPLARQFPLAKLPLELREKVWEESILFARQPRRQNNTEQVRKFGAVDVATFYTFGSPALAAVCREAHAVVKRLQRNGDKDAFVNHETRVGVLYHLADDNKELRLASLVEGNNIPLVLDMPWITLNQKNALSLQRGPNKHGQRVMELLLAAKDNQIKIVYEQHHKFILPCTIANLRAVARGWLWGKRLVSVHDKLAWEELKSIAAAVGLPWALPDALLDADPARRMEIVAKAMGPVEDLWKREDQRLKRSGKAGAEPLPKIDVCIRVHVGRTLGPRDDWDGLFITTAFDNWIR
ncbi:hypothetical protein B0T16DRAFT_170967 [Cercophora newfieldiana]|uniref:2EXR domain-containing protein n=1 Tax=Cercophora newfieldiana TaxID=92897 RepID=A0AA39Y8L9_9PEZI|nr:hypothetical protein B0T16DRAFT_170967 [Cercophora newfieldiana]